MIFGTGLLLNLHVLITLVGIVSGLVVLADLMGGTLPRGWNAVFLIFNNPDQRHRLCLLPQQPPHLPRPDPGCHRTGPIWRSRFTPSTPGGWKGAGGPSMW